MLGPHASEHLFVVLALGLIPPDLLVPLQVIGHHIAHGYQQPAVQHQTFQVRKTF
jgi:hypothetical protein